MGYNTCTSKLEQNYTINAPTSEVWLALTDAKTAEEWGASPARVEPVEGGEFSYWGGDIHGVFTKLVPEKLIEHNWFGHDHPERKFVATFTFETNDDSSTSVHLAHIGERDDMQKDIADWRDYYFDPIKKLLETK